MLKNKNFFAYRIYSDVNIDSKIFTCQSTNPVILNQLQDLFRNHPLIQKTEKAYEIEKPDQVGL
jgi:hypothetical protein